jgi:type I restriction enzyme M protein
LRIVGLVELTRRIFLKSNADLRSNVLVGQKLTGSVLARARDSNYPIYADMVRKVGFKLGKGYSPLFVRDRDTGIEIRDERNGLTPDTDFRRISAIFGAFTEQSKWERASGRQPAPEGWAGATIGDVLNHPNLDLKPRRLMPRALANVRGVKQQRHIKLYDIADLVTETVDILDGEASKLWRLVAGQDIRAVEGIVMPSHPRRAWQIADMKQRKLYPLQRSDIIIGLVRPERRNIGLLLDSGDDIVGAPDGIGVVRIKPQYAQQFPYEWLFATLRSEPCRLQFWTESGGTRYGKLTDDHIEGVLLPLPSDDDIRRTTKHIRAWSITVERNAAAWSIIGPDPDRKPILNSSGFGLIETEDWDDEWDEED